MKGGRHSLALIQSPLCHPCGRSASNSEARSTTVSWFTGWFSRRAPRRAPGGLRGSRTPRYVCVGFKYRWIEVYYVPRCFSLFLSLHSSVRMFAFEVGHSTTGMTLTLLPALNPTQSHDVCLKSGMVLFRRCKRGCRMTYVVWVLTLCPVLLDSPAGTVVLYIAPFCALEP